MITKRQLIEALQSMTEIPDDGEVVMFSMYHQPIECNSEEIVSVAQGFSQAYEGKIILRNYNPPEIVQNGGKPAPEHEDNNENDDDMHYLYKE
jgi:hypothetical protein